MRTPVYVQAPPGRPVGYGLLAASATDDNPPEHFQLGIEYEPAYCGPALAETPTGDTIACGPVQLDIDNDTGITLVEGVPFLVYKPFRCSPVGRRPEDQKARAETGLAMGEQRAVEAVVSAAMPHADTAVDLTPVAGTAVDIVDGIAMLEQYAGENYGSVPVIHSERGTAIVLAARALVKQNAGRLETMLGTWVAAGAGYSLGAPDTGTLAPAGEQWLYVTGTVLQTRGAVRTNDPILEVNTNGAKNNLLTIAEREYVVTWECITAAVLVRGHAEQPVREVP